MLTYEAVETNETDETNQTNGTISSRDSIVMIMLVNCLGLVLSMTMLLSSVKKEFLVTFYSSKTSNEHLQEYFTLVDEDELRIELFQKNERKWRPFIGVEVKAWVNKRLPLWLEEKPDWFDEARRASIQDWMIDDKEMFKKVKEKVEGGG